MCDAKDSASSNKAQQEFKEYESDIVDVIGDVAYHRILQRYQRVTGKRLIKKNIEVVSMFA